MARAFDPGPVDARFLDLMDDPPGEAAYPWPDFRLEWGPVFYRGRVDGTARVLVVGQDPGQHECIARRNLVGLAGQRVQGFLAKLGMTRSYVMLNAYLYACATAGAATRRKDHPDHAPDRDAWFAAVLATSPIEVVIAFGSPAAAAWEGWLGRRGGGPAPALVKVLHPTWRGPTAQLLANWNQGLAAAFASLGSRDVQVGLVPYGATLRPEDLASIPAADLPAGTPAWMGGPVEWAVRRGSPPIPARARIVVTVPPGGRGWTP